MPETSGITELEAMAVGRLVITNEQAAPGETLAGFGEPTPREA